MPRPPLPPGTAGKVRYQTLGKRRIRARVNVRDYDGVTREVTRFGETKAAAERRLKVALRDRVGAPTGGQITSETRLRDAAKLWWAEVEESDASEGTKDTYGRALNNRVIPALGGLLMREIGVPEADRFIKAVRTNHGPSAAKTCKSVLSLLLGMAVRHGALGDRTNPVRDTAKISAGRKARPRALTVDEQEALLAKVRSDEEAREQDIADLIEFLDGTGVRVGEALAMRAEVIDREASVIEVNATIVRLTGKGAVLQERPKTAAGWRVIAVPKHIIALCDRRLGMSWPNRDQPITVITADGDEVQRRAGELGVLFLGLSGGLRSPSNANRDIRRVLDRIDEEAYGWVTTHTWRKTVATRLDDAGLSARKIADHLGHAKPSMTQDVYMGRGVAAAEAAAILGKGSS